MAKFFRIDLQDGMLFPSGMLAQADNQCHIYLQAADGWASGDQLAEPQLEAVFEQLYGEDWREGNEDGSRYYVVSMNTALLSDAEVASSVWLADKAQKSADNFWFYQVSDSGEFENKEAEQFNR